MFTLKPPRIKDSNEAGFTLVEILVVILIIGILAAIAVPIVTNQRKQAAISAVKSDLKNAALSMETEAVGNKGKFLSYVPNYNPRSAGVQVSLNNHASSTKKFCLTGRSETYPDVILSYDSVTGGLLDLGKACAPVTAEDTSFSVTLANKKALIVYARYANDPMGLAGTVKSYLTTYGYGTVDVVNNPDPATYANYDVIVATAYAWNIPPEVSAKLATGYDAGAHILTDGNDNTAGFMPRLIKTSVAKSSGGSFFNQTGNTGLSPSFPYTFQSSSFRPDNWSCVTEAVPGVVTIADSPDPAGGATRCLTALGMSSGNGRWVNLTVAPMEAGNDTSMTDASLNWLTY